MTSAPVRLAVFDCDGTLVDGQADVCWAMERAFTRAGLTPPDNHDVRRIVGLSLPAAVRTLAPSLSDSESRAVAEFYRSSFRARREEGLLDEPLYDGIAELLRRMHAGGWRLAVATGKSDRGLAACLADHGIADLFVSLQTADRHPSKPHPAMLEAALFDAGALPGEAVMIGDTSFDMIMARSIGVAAIGVGWGYHDTAELLGSGAGRVVQDAAELAAALEEFCHERQSARPPQRRRRNGFLILNMVRLSGIGLVLLGLAIARGLIDLPWIAGAVIAVVGLVEFFFLPRIIARAWKAGDETRR